VDLGDAFGIDSQGELDAIASDDGSGNAVLDFGNGNQLVLLGVDYRLLLIDSFV